MANNPQECFYLRIYLAHLLLPCFCRQLTCECGLLCAPQPHIFHQGDALANQRQDQQPKNYQTRGQWGHGAHGINDGAQANHCARQHSGSKERKKAKRLFEVLKGKRWLYQRLGGGSVTSRGLLRRRRTPTTPARGTSK